MTMTCALSRVRFAEREVLRYRRDVEDGAKGPDVSAPEGWAWGEVVAKANFLFERIIDLDLGIQELVLADEVDFDPALDTKVRGLLRDWLDVSLRAIPQVEGHTVDGADLLRARIAEAQSALRPDGAFFGGHELARLRDEAIDETRWADEPFDVDVAPRTDAGPGMTL